MIEIDISRERVVLPQQEKIVTYHRAIEIIKEEQQAGKVIVSASGVFDIVHKGHVDFLRAAKKAGDFLVVGVESDETVRLNKGEKRPINTQDRRVDLLSEWMSIDIVVPFSDCVNYHTGGPEFTKRYMDLNPDFVAVGITESYINDKIAEIQRAGINIALATHKDPWSSTKILKLFGYE